MRFIHCGANVSSKLRSNSAGSGGRMATAMRGTRRPRPIRGKRGVVDAATVHAHGCHLATGTWVTDTIQEMPGCAEGGFDPGSLDRARRSGACQRAASLLRSALPRSSASRLRTKFRLARESGPSPPPPFSPRPHLRRASSRAFFSAARFRPLPFQPQPSPPPSSRPRLRCRVFAFLELLRRLSSSCCPRSARRSSSSLRSISSRVRLRRTLLFDGRGFRLGSGSWFGHRLGSRRRRAASGSGRDAFQHALIDHRALRWPRRRRAAALRFQ